MTESKVHVNCETPSVGAEDAIEFENRTCTVVRMKMAEWYDEKWGPLAEWLNQPLHRRRPRRILVACDLFDKDVYDETIDRVFAIIAMCPRHTFLVLTKCPARMRKYLIGHAAGGQDTWRIGQSTTLRSKPDAGWLPPNVWLGVPVEDQASAAERIPDLLATPAALRFISAEPLLGPVDLTGVLPCAALLSRHSAWYATLDWVIVGGEIGRDARPMHPDWVRSLRDQCQAAGVPFFFQGWGEYRMSSAEEWEADDGTHRHMLVAPDGRYGNTVADLITQPPGTVWMRRVGKRAAGRLLDGREWSEVPVAGRHRAPPQIEERHND